MKAHNLMQAIARANRVFPGKDCGVIVDYNGCSRACARHWRSMPWATRTTVAVPGESWPRLRNWLRALLQAIEAAEKQLLKLGFDAARLHAATGFDRIEALRDAVDALYTSDGAKRRFEIVARQVFIRFKALLMERSILAYAERHDNIETIYKNCRAGATWQT